VEERNVSSKAPRETEQRSNDLQQALAGKYLTFALATEEYGLPVLRVREIIKVMDITVVPQVPHYVRGVINLRGKVIAVVDLRQKFGLEAIPPGDRSAIIVVELDLPAGRTLVGVLVDAVSEVLNIVPDEIEPTPTFGDTVDTTFMLGVAKVKGTVKILLDLNRVFEAEGALPRVA
jgi:purine-binding chemotaxis protein CheW